MKALKAVSKAMGWTEEVLIVVLMTFMVTLNFVNVVARKGFHASLSFTEELTIIAFVWVTMIGISAAYKRGAHLGMTFIVDHLPPKPRAVLITISTLFSMALICIMIMYGFRMVQSQIAMHATTPALMLPVWIQGLSIPIGGIFMAFRTIEASVPIIRDLWKGNENEEEGVIPQ